MKNKAGRSSLFLTELVLDLLIFSLCAVVCVGMFARAHNTSMKSLHLTDAVAIAQSAAELIKGGADPQTAARDGYTLTVTDNISFVRIDVSVDDEVVYSLNAPGEGAFR